MIIQNIGKISVYDKSHLFLLSDWQCAFMFLFSVLGSLCSRMLMRNGAFVMILIMVHCE